MSMRVLQSRGSWAKEETLLMATSEWLIIALLTTVCIIHQNHAQGTCGIIGDGNENMVTKTTDRMFYLNTANPAPCSGNITSWRVCYYGPNSTSNSFPFARSYWATYAVYRRVGTGVDERYIRVSEIFKAVRGSTFARFREGRNVVDGPIRSGFRCYTDSLDSAEASESVTVQAGDVIGACVFDPANERILNRRQLDVVGESRSRHGSGSSLLAVSTTEGCSMDTLLSNIPTSQLSVVNSKRLHIYANLEAGQPTSETVTVPTVVSTEFPSSTTQSTITTVTSDSISTNSTKSTSRGGNQSTVHVSASISPTSTMSCSTNTASSAINMHSSTVHNMGSSPAPSETISSDQVIGIAVGSTVGVLILAAMLVTLIAVALCLISKKCRKTSLDFSANVAYSKSNMPVVYNSAILTEQNTAYASLSVGDNIKGFESDVEYESFHDSTRTEYYSEAKRASIVDSSSQVSDNNEPSMFSNIAYGSSSNIITLC